MKLAIVSDTHFGDPKCSLVDERGATTATYAALKDAAGTDNDYLVLLGDIFDFSVVHYEEAFAKARTFFEAIQRDHLCRDVIYVPGNHDGDFWHLLQFEVTVIKPIRKGREPRPLHHAVPGVIDDRADTATPGLWLPTEGEDAEGIEAARERGRKHREGIFLDGIFSGGSDGRSRFWVAYPNLYLVTRNGECILATHGHYFETYWTAGSELALNLAGPALASGLQQMRAELKTESTVGPYTAVEPTVGMNFPLNQLSCSGIGQAGPLTAVVRSIQNAVKDHELSPVREYYARLAAAIEHVTPLSWGQRAMLDLGLLLLKRPLFAKLANYEDARTQGAEPTSESFKENFARYILASRREVEMINATRSFRTHVIPEPSRVIFGHTHAPGDFHLDGYSVPDGAHDGGERRVPVANTGGWLRGKDGSVPGFVMRYDTDSGLTARAVGPAGTTAASGRTVESHPRGAPVVA